MSGKEVRLTECAVQSTDGIGCVWLNSSGSVVDRCHCVEVNCRVLTHKVKGILLRKIIGVLSVNCEGFDNFEVGLVDCMSSLDIRVPVLRTKK